MTIDTEYYSDNTRISNSSLGWFLKSPRYFRDRLDGNISEEPTAAMLSGTLTHLYLLQQEEFKKQYRMLDFEAPTAPLQKKFALDYIRSEQTDTNLRAHEAFNCCYSTTGMSDEKITAKGLEMAENMKQYIEWLSANENNQQTITSSKLNSLRVTKENVRLHKLAKELLLNDSDSPELKTHSEFHINWEITVDGVKTACKSLIDRLIIDHANKKVTLVDIKTTANVNDFSKSFNEYDYGRQMAFYWAAIYWYFTNELKIELDEYQHNTYIVAIQNNNGYACRVFSVNDSVILDKTTTIKQILTNINWHSTNNKWDYTKEYYEGDGSEPLLNDI